MHWMAMVDTLQRFWSQQGCLILHPYDVEKGAGTMNPHTFLRSLGPEPFRVGYIEACRRPADGRYGENPNRLYQHHQFQVLVKPTPDTIQDTYLDSLRALGLELTQHDVRFVEDNWENPTFGAAGLGWEVWLDGMEITQFTYFQQVGSVQLDVIPVELTYGLERLATYIQQKDNVFELAISDDQTATYRDVFHQAEYEQSAYSLDHADVELLVQLFAAYEQEADRVLRDYHLAYPAYDYVLKCSHVFNILEARGALSVTERALYIGRVRRLARHVAKVHIAERKRRGFPLCKEKDASEAAGTPASEQQATEHQDPGKGEGLHA